MNMSSDVATLKERRIYVTGARGMVGTALTTQLAAGGYNNLLTPERSTVDLADMAATRDYFAEQRPEVVIHMAARVGGIYASSNYNAEFLYDNLMIGSNVIHAAHEHQVKKLIFIGSSCIYPRLAEQPMREEALLTGPLEPENEGYAIGKIVGVKMCESYHRQYGSNFYAVMPPNLYGPNDNFDLKTSHVIAALIRRFHEARLAGESEVRVWGTGRPRREFLFVEDLADGLIFCLENVEAGDVYRQGISQINLGYGRDVSIRELAEMIRQLTGFEGDIKFDPDRPDGMPQKLVDVSRLAAMGWTSRTSLEDGLRKTYEWFLGKDPATLRHK